MKCKMILFCIFLIGRLLAQETFDRNLEKIALQNIEQITFTAMGFEKAGEAYFSPDGQQIIFQAVPKGEEDYQIYNMDLKDRIPRLVSTGKGACTCGFYRPDGKKIIFASSHESPASMKKKEKAEKYKWDLIPYMNIYEADPDGSHLRRLTNGSAYHAECGYSPDGKSIVYASNEEGSMNLYVMEQDGSKVRQLTQTKHCYNGGPFFSPDGKQIIFRADREEADFLQLFVMNVDGTQERQLTFGTSVNWAPFWHPDGQVIAYTTSRHGHASYEIYLLNVFTGAEHRLTHNPSFDGLPSFSCDGKKILWTSKRNEGTCHIFMADFSMPSHLHQENQSEKQ